MQKLSTVQLREMVESKYFGNVDQKFLSSVMACFLPDATLTIQTANLTHNGAGEIRRMFDTFFHRYRKIWHGDFHWTVDVEKQKVAVQFVATRDTHDGEHQRALNANFFEFDNGMIKTITIYPPFPR